MDSFLAQLIQYFRLLIDCLHNCCSDLCISFDSHSPFWNFLEFQCVSMNQLRIGFQPHSDRFPQRRSQRQCAYFGNTFLFLVLDHFSLNMLKSQLFPQFGVFVDVHVADWRLHVL